MDTETAAVQPSRMMRILDAIERVGNRLPHPTSLFFILCLLILVLSWLCGMLGVSAVHPITGNTVTAVNLLSVEGLHLMLANTVTNFTGFAPLGTVLVAMLGIGIAEQSGLLSSVLRLLVLSAPKRLLTFVVVFAGVLSSLAADAGYVVLIPLSALVFIAAGRHPIAGIAAAFAGVSGGFSANLSIGPLDALLAGISTESAKLFIDYEVSAAANWYFIFVSTFMIAIVGAWVTEKLVVPRLPEWKPDAGTTTADNLNEEERRGLRYAGVASLVLIGILLIGLLPESGVLRDPETGSIVKSPFINGIVTVIALFVALVGIAYGIGAKTIKNDRDIINSMESTMGTMAAYLVLMFFAAQFVNYFAWTNLGLISAINGSIFLKSLGWGPVPLLLIFILFAAMINLFIGSASAKWAIVAPVFVPMLMILGIAPETTQVAYRIGDSVTNIITPLMPYFALVVAFVQRYDKEAGIGTIIAVMLPYSVCFLIAWSVLLSAWVLLGAPLGPDAQLFIEPVNTNVTKP
ncbi:MAG: AbgT family transporter [Pseudomonadota bacterium]